MAALLLSASTAAGGAAGDEPSGGSGAVAADGSAAADGAAAAAAGDGAGGGGAGVGAIVVPNLSLCTEYTGEPILLEPQLPPGAAGDGAAGGAAMARVVPYQVDALLEALPKRLVGPNLDPPPQSRCRRCLDGAHLPDKLADLPASASALPGGAWGAPIAGGGALPVDAKRGRTGQDAFTARQRKKQALGMVAAAGAHKGTRRRRRECRDRVGGRVPGPARRHLREPLLAPHV